MKDRGMDVRNRTYHAGSLRERVEQAIAFQRSDTTICEQFDVSVEYIALVRQMLDAVHYDDHVDVKDLESQLTTLTRYRQRYGQWPAHAQLE